ncbi:MAG: ABC transporter ATP-binding protein [Firmicutes bacterium]|nr:ABC transporter ATP-binding protein [Bacillota bacterium]
MDYVIEMLHITKDFPGIRANDDVTLTLKRGEIHALLGENGAGKSTLMSVLFGMYAADKGVIKKNGQVISIHSPSGANSLGIGMVHQHFKLVHNFTVLENIVLGVETVSRGMLRMDEARAKVIELSKRYGMMVDPDAFISDITVGMQQRVEILKMLYRDNEILIFDEPTAVLTPQEITELMHIMKGLAAEGKSLLFITHKLNEIKEVADRCTVLRKGRCIGTVDVADTSKEAMSEMMVGRKVDFAVEKGPAKPGKAALLVQNLRVKGRNHSKPLVNNVSFTVRKGEIVCVAGVDGNGQSELVYALTGLMPIDGGRIFMGDSEITNASIRQRNDAGLSHIPEDRHKHGLVLEYMLAENLILKSYHKPAFQRHGLLRFDEMYKYADMLIEAFDIRSGQGSRTITASMSGGNQQKAIVAREINQRPEVLIAMQPTRGLDIGAIEYIHKQLIAARDDGKAVLLVSLELDEVMNVSDRILVMYEGEIVADVPAKETTVQELGLYMTGSRRSEVV